MQNHGRKCKPYGTHGEEYNMICSGLIMPDQGDKRGGGQDISRMLYGV